MTLINLTDSPADIFKAAAVDCHKTALALEAAKARISAEQAAYDNANANLQWVAAHPALADVDKNALYKEATANVTLEESAPEPEKPAEEKPAEAPRRKRRTKEQIAADKAREEAEKAAKNPPASDSDDAAQAVEGAGVSGALEKALDEAVGGALPEGTNEVVNNTGTPEPVVSDPFAGNAQPAAPAPTPAPAPQAAPAAVPTAGADPFDPFGTGA